MIRLNFFLLLLLMTTQVYSAEKAKIVEDECALVDQHEATSKAAKTVMSAPNPYPKEFEAGVWYFDWDKNNENYIALYNKKDPSSSKLLKVIVNSDCTVNKMYIDDNKKLLEYLVELTNKNIKKDKAIGNNCESVSEQTAICDGNLYKRDSTTTNSLTRDVKKIEDYSDKNKTAPAKSAVSK